MDSYYTISINNISYAIERTSSKSKKKCNNQQDPNKSRRGEIQFFRESSAFKEDMKNSQIISHLGKSKKIKIKLHLPLNDNAAPSSSNSYPYSTDNSSIQKKISIKCISPPSGPSCSWIIIRKKRRADLV